MKKTIVLLLFPVLLTLVPIQSGYSQVNEKTSPVNTQKEQQKLDIVLVLDNSGSMKKNDPDFLARDVVTKFLLRLGEKSRLGIVVFDQEARLSKKLIEIEGSYARAEFMESLDNLNYTGQFSNIPAAIERAIYELKKHGRKHARKIIILLTDGIVDTGDRRQDLEREKWLKDELTQESKKAEIRIIGIAFSDRADFSLIQTLALKTNGEYFRAYGIEDIEGVFKKINEVISEPISKPVIRVSLKTEQVPPTPPTTEPIAPTTPSKLKSAVPQAQKMPYTQKETIHIPLILGGVILCLIIIVIIMIFKGKSKTPLTADGIATIPDHPPQAELRDIKNITGKETLALDKRIIKIGRDTNNDITIPKETISSLHATIEYKDGFFYLEDQRSRNKTYLDGKEIEPHSPKKLKSGDQIMFNVYKFIFLLSDHVPAGETLMDFNKYSETLIDKDTVIDAPGSSPSIDSIIPQALLIDVNNISGKKTMMINKRITKIGRGGDNDVVIPKDSVSASHAVIEYKDGFFHLEDQRSKNKTRLDGEEIEPHSPIKLKSGDEIMFHDYEFIFMLEDQTPSGETDKKF